jgi:hypothetical protein
MAGSLTEQEKTEFVDVLRDMEGVINRIIHIVSDLRTFTRGDVTAFEMVPVSKIVDSALRFLSHEWREKVQIEKHIPEGQTLWANCNQTTQVLVNLLQNALDSLKSKDFAGADPTIWLLGEEAKPAVELETLGKLMDGLERLTGETITFNDVLEKEPPKQNSLLEELLKNAKPFDWEEMKKLIPEWTPEERAENERFMQALEQQRAIDRELSNKRDQR